MSPRLCMFTGFCSSVIATPRSRARRLAYALLSALSACSGSEPEYFPLDDGRRWEYRQTTTVLEETHRDSFQIRSIGVVKHDRKKVTVMEYPGNARGYYARTAEGWVRVGTARGVDGRVRIDDDRHFILREPLQPGTAWDLPSRLTLIESIFYEAGERIRDRRLPVTLTYATESVGDTVTVPAGSYSNCVKVIATGSAVIRVNQGANFAHVDVHHADWYAPGVGLVKSERKETSDSHFLKPGKYVQELLSTE